MSKPSAMSAELSARLALETSSMHLGNFTYHGVPIDSSWEKDDLLNVALLAMRELTVFRQVHLLELGLEIEGT